MIPTVQHWRRSRVMMQVVVLVQVLGLAPAENVSVGYSNANPNAHGSLLQLYIIAPQGEPVHVVVRCPA